MLLKPSLKCWMRGDFLQKDSGAEHHLHLWVKFGHCFLEKGLCVCLWVKASTYQANSRTSDSVGLVDANLLAKFEQYAQFCRPLPAGLCWIGSRAITKARLMKLGSTWWKQNPFDWIHNKFDTYSSLITYLRLCSSATQMSSFCLQYAL